MQLTHIKLWMLLFITLCLSQSALTCTRVLYTKENAPVLVGNNMDWITDLKTNLFVYPRGLAHDGKVAINSLKWTSKYGSIVASAYDELSTNGMNEKGLAAHFLVLLQSIYGKRDINKPGLSLDLLVQFYLDNFASVNEAVEFTQQESFQIVPYFDPRTNMLVHLHVALEDASGDSAIIEFIDGYPRIYHGKEHRVLTNDPFYDHQRWNLRKYDGFGGTLPLPGTSNSKDRFVRASYYLARLPDADSTNDAVHHVLSVLNNAAAPYYTTNGSGHFIGATIWQTVSDLTHRVYYFGNTLRNNLIWAQLDKFDLSAGQSVKKLNMVTQTDLVGDVSNKFENIKN